MDNNKYYNKITNKKYKIIYKKLFINNNKI